MKTLISFILLTLLCSCCNSSNKVVEKQYKFHVSTTSGTGWNAGYAYVNCDSVQMISAREAIVWIDGSKSKIIANRILIQTK